MRKVYNKNLKQWITGVIGSTVIVLSPFIYIFAEEIREFIFKLLE